MATCDCIELGNCVNFRSIYHDASDSSRLYRSSRPDLLNEEEVKHFRDQLNIKCIIDLRSLSEYNKATGDKLIDQHYSLFELKHPKKRNYHPHEEVISQPLALSIDNPTEHKCERRHYILEIFKDYGMTIFRRAPWYLRIYSFFVLIFDFLRRKGLNNFICLYTKKIVNPAGILGQYKDILVIGQTHISAVLKLISKPNHVPALLHCTYGKDRTGVLCALILSCLGKDKHYIAKNYALSELALKNHQQVIREQIIEKYKLNESFTTAKEETMLKLMDHIQETYGSVSNYLENIGFSQEEQEQLRRNLCG